MVKDLLLSFYLQNTPNSPHFTSQHEVSGMFEHCLNCFCTVYQFLSFIITYLPAVTPLPRHHLHLWLGDLPQARAGGHSPGHCQALCKPFHSLKKKFKCKPFFVLLQPVHIYRHVPVPVPVPVRVYPAPVYAPAPAYGGGGGYGGDDYYRK